MIGLSFCLMVAAPASAAPIEGGAQCVEDSFCPYSGEIYWSCGRIALLKRRCVEFHRLPKGVRAFVGVSFATAKPLERVALPRGSLYFRKGTTEVSVAPAALRRFSVDLLPPGHASGRRDAFLACASAAEGYCGALDLRGREIIKLAARPPGGSIEPLGLTEDGAEALFAVVGPEPRRETTGYLVRAKDGTQRSTGVDDSDAQRLLTLFRGPAVLPEP